jgi:diguanylate cyclase (GGDEF)-like protein
MSNRSDGGPDSDSTHGADPGGYADQGSRVARAAACPGSVVRSPNTPYRVLGSIQLLVALFAALFLLVSPMVSRLWTADLVVVIVLLPLGVATWRLGPRSRYGWALGASLAVSEGLAVLGMLLIDTAEGQLTVALGLVMFGVFAGYFRPKPWLYGHVLLLTGGFGLIAGMNPHLDSPVVALLAMAVIAGVTLLVSSLADHLRRLALLDSLTGTLNRRGLDIVGAQVVAAAERSEQQVVVGLVDLDGFKHYNDTRGHASGDALLVDVAEAWRSALRRTDVLARYGGDEFALVLPGADSDHLDDLVRRVRSGTPAPFSVGFSGWLPAEDLYEALKRADDELFRAKRSRT